MLAKLRNLRQERASGKTPSNLLERFKFLKEKNRKTCLKNLNTWNKRFGSVVNTACRAADRRRAVVVHQKDKGPSSRLRTLSKRLFSALWKRWSCDCENPHEARFCIATCGGGGHANGKDPGKTTGIAFDFLMSHHQSRWCEGTVVIESIKRYAPFRPPLRKVDSTWH